MRQTHFTGGENSVYNGEMINTMGMETDTEILLNKRMKHSGSKKLHPKKGSLSPSRVSGRGAYMKTVKSQNRFADPYYYQQTQSYNLGMN